MLQEDNSPRKGLILTSAMVICLLVVLSMMVPDEPLKGFWEFASALLLYALMVFLIFPFWVRSIWNNIIPGFSSLKQIDYWQALGLTVLVSILTVLIP